MMYSNKYYLEMNISKRGKKAFTNVEKIMLEDIRRTHNQRFACMTRKQSKNKKFISKITTNANGMLGIYLETEFPIVHVNRIGNALRMFSIIAASNGFSMYVANQRLMKAA